MRKLEIDKWERKEIFDFMSALSDPFYTVCFNIDVTNLYEYTHKKKLSFYYALVYLATQSINEVPAFLNELIDSEIVVLDRRSPSFCDIRKGSEAFYIVNMLLGNDMDDFCKKAKEISLSQTSFFPKDKPENEAWIYFSCIPWMDITCITNERDFNPDDTVPRISWGKYVSCNGRKKLNMSLEVNHRFIDGFHIGLFESYLTEKISLLE